MSKEFRRGWDAAMAERLPCACGGREPLKRYTGFFRTWPSGATEVRHGKRKEGDIDAEVLILPAEETV